MMAICSDITDGEKYKKEGLAPPFLLSPTKLLLNSHFLLMTLLGIIKTNLCGFLLANIQNLLYYFIPETTIVPIHTRIAEARKKLNIFYKPFNLLKDIRLQ